MTNSSSGSSEHPEVCRERDLDGEHPCSIGWFTDQGGVKFSLEYSGTPVTGPGRYPVIFWSEVLRGPEYTEHDASIAVQGDRQPLTAADIERIGE